MEYALLGGRELALWETLAQGGGVFLLHSFNNRVMRTVFHEMGHALRWTAIDERNYYVFLTAAGGKGKEVGGNFFRYFIEKILHPLRGGATKLGVKDDEVLTTSAVIKSELIPKLISGAGGLNNEAYLAERLVEKFYENRVMGFVELMLYSREVSAISSYWEAIDTEEKGEREEQEKKGIDASDDVIAILARYKLLGIPVTKEDMVRTGTIATWLSGTTYSHIVALWNFAWDKHLYCARPLEFFGFAVPDTFPYLTTKGISYKVISGYRLNEKIRILFGFEHVFVGIPTTEYMLGIRHKLGEVYRNVSYKIVTVFGKQGFNLESSFSIPIGSFSFTAGFNTYASQSLLGERHSMDLNKKQSHTVYLSVAYVY